MLLNWKQPDRLRVATQVLTSSDGSCMRLIFPLQKEGEEAEETVLVLNASSVGTTASPGAGGRIRALNVVLLGAAEGGVIFDCV